ncbi:MAG TPA: glycoside hydrolase family 2 [Methylomirabilota bacterium]|nr:glycoside hydrolase family 2 [Methylomirabilota bacterium]
MPNPYVYPRPEYPRPDRQRGSVEGTDWLNLNGPWQFRFDGERRGMEERWFEVDEAVTWREQIIVPFCWESLAAWGEADAAGNDNYYSTRVFRNPLEVTRANHRYAPRYEIGWYRRWVEVPDGPSWDGKRVILTIGAADFFTDAWCNGTPVGHHEGGYLPFEFDITDTLTRGADGKRRGLIVIRVEDPMDNKEQPVGKQWRWYTTVSGIWQTVYIEPRHQKHIDCFKIVTDIDAGTVRFEVDCVDSPQAELEVCISPPEGEIKTVRLKVSNNRAEQLVDLKPVFLWDPNEPNLYWVTMRLKEQGRTLDEVRTYFGMRRIATSRSEDPNAPDALCLNNVPRYMRGALHQSYYPEGVYTARDVSTIKNDIAYAKKVGFNFLRIHIKIDDPLLLYHADKMGMLIMADFPNFGENGDTPLARKRYEEMMRGAIKRDFNHPCIFAWCCFNETWGFGGQLELVKHFYPSDEERGLSSEPPAGGFSGLNPQAAERTTQHAHDQLPHARDEAEAATTKLKVANSSSHAWVQRMWVLAKQLDPTRLIEDMSVVHWEHLDYYAHGETDINSWHFYIHDYYKAKEHIEKVVGATYSGSNFNYVEGFQQKGQPLINSEYGGIGALDGDRDVSWSFKFLTNELRRHGSISGYIYTELHDVEWEYNGFLNYDRTPKEFGYDPVIINESDVIPVNYAPVSRHEPGSRVKVEVSSSHYTTKPHKDVTLIWRLDGIDSLGRIHQDLVRGSAPIAFPHRRVAHAHTIELELPREIMLCTLSIEACKAERGSCVARNYVQFFVTPGYPPEREERGPNLILRARPGNWVASQWNQYAGERDRERAEDNCYGYSNGFFEWAFPLDGVDLSRARRIRVLCEASSRRVDTPQTDVDHFQTRFQMFLNGLRVYEATLPNHPHDARGALSYLREGKGAYGYLAHATAEGSLLQQIAQHAEGKLTLRCAVPPDALAQGGLTIYGAECGRYPVGPTIVVEW